MSWFSRKKEVAPPPVEKFDKIPEATDDQTFGSTNFSDSSNSPSSYSDTSGKKMTQLNQAAVEQLVMQEQARQAQMMFLNKLCDLAFDKCVSKPGTEMSSYETDCVAAVMHKHVDAQKLVIGRYQRQQAAQQQLN